MSLPSCLTMLTWHAVMSMCCKAHLNGLYMLYSPLRPRGPTLVCQWVWCMSADTMGCQWTGMHVAVYECKHSRVWLSVSGETAVREQWSSWSSVFTAHRCLSALNERLLCFQEQANLVHWSFKFICLCLQENSADKAFGVWHFFDDTAHWPRVAWSLAVHDENYISCGEVPIFGVPFLTLLHQW